MYDLVFTMQGWLIDFIFQFKKNNIIHSTTIMVLYNYWDICLQYIVNTLPPSPTPSTQASVVATCLCGESCLPTPASITLYTDLGSPSLFLLRVQGHLCCCE